MGRVVVAAGGIVFFLVVVLGARQLVWAEGSSVRDAELQATAISLVAEREQLDASSLQVVAAAEAVYPESGARVYDVKVLSEATGQTYMVRLNRAGQEVDTALVDAAEQSAIADRYGKFDAELAEHLRFVGPAETTLVSVWVNDPPYAPPYEEPLAGSAGAPGPGSPTVSRGEIDAVRAVRMEHRKAFVDAVMAPVIAEMSALGISGITRPIPTIAFLYVYATRDQVEQISAIDAVLEIYIVGDVEDD